MKVVPFSCGSDSASPRCCTADIDPWLIEAELKSKLISRSIFGLLAAIVSSWLRSSIESERVERLRTVLMKLLLAARGGSTVRPRVSGGAFSELRIALVEGLLSPANATPAVIDSAALMAIALSPKNLTKLVIVVILKIKRLMAIGWAEHRTGSNT